MRAESQQVVDVAKVLLNPHNAQPLNLTLHPPLLHIANPLNLLFRLINLHHIDLIQHPIKPILPLPALLIILIPIGHSQRVGPDKLHLDVGLFEEGLQVVHCLEEHFV